MDRILKFAAGAAAVAGLAAIAAVSVPSADASDGSSLYRMQCGSCHSVKPDGRSGIGPNLYSVVGRRAGTLHGYNFSPAMKHAGLTWSTDELKLYIADPKKVVPGDKMPYAGLHNPAKVDEIVTYLASLN